jgi:5-formyltetrahydrofolate cyclo-ligase
VKSEITAKAELRTHLRGVRRAFVAERGSAVLVLDSILTSHVKALIDNIKYASLYCARSGECDVMAAITGVLPPTVELALPCATSKSAPLVFRRWHIGDPRVTGPLGFDEPLENAPEVAPDLIFAPLIGFDRKLNRLGQGAGHYDQAFAAFPNAVRIGIAWSCQEVDVIPTDPWDVPLDGIITEKEWIPAFPKRIIDEQA